MGGGTTVSDFFTKSPNLKTKLFFFFGGGGEGGRKGGTRLSEFFILRTQI